MSDLNSIVFNIAQSAPGFLLAIVIHEWAHAQVATWCGDQTAKNAGRLTLNPAAHYDPWGTIFFPLLGAITGFAIIGWARPVPVDARNFKKYNHGLFWVSFAGPLSNLILGTASAFFYAIVATKVSSEFEYYKIFLGMLSFSVYINFILAFFNLIPLPPLDGSKMVSAFLKGPTLYKYEGLIRYAPMIFIGVMVLGMMGIHTLGYLLMPARFLGNFFVYTFISMFANF